MRNTNTEDKPTGSTVSTKLGSESRDDPQLGGSVNPGGPIDPAGISQYQSASALIQP